MQRQRKNEIIDIAAEQGIPLTEKDFEPSEEDKPVNFDELGSAAGGKVCACVAGGLRVTGECYPRAHCVHLYKVISLC